jgi:hypothetical protein
MKKTLCLLIALSFFAGVLSVPVYASDYMRSPSSSQYESDYGDVAEDIPGEFVIVDAILFRPLGIVAMACGFAGTLVSWPWAATSNSSEIVGQKLLKEPFDYTFRRPLGDVVEPAMGTP